MIQQLQNMNTMSTLTTNEMDKRLNETISNVISHVKENPSAKAVTFSVDSILEKGFRSEINVRDFQFIVDEMEKLFMKINTHSFIEAA